MVAIQRDDTFRPTVKPTVKPTFYSGPEIEYRDGIPIYKVNAPPPRTSVFIPEIPKPGPEPLTMAEMEAITPPPKMISDQNAGIAAAVIAQKDDATINPEGNLGLFKNIANAIIGNVTEKTLSKSGLSETQKDEFRERQTTALETSGVNKKINTFDKAATTSLAIAAGAATVFAPGVGGLIPTGSGPLSKLQPEPTTAAGPLAATQRTLETGGAMPAWLVPVAIVAGLLLFGKKLLRG